MNLEIWVVFPDTERASTAAVRSQLRNECRNRSWQMQEKVSRVRRVNGRPLQLVTAIDAVNLYRRSHRVRVAVFFTGKPFVPLSPDARAVRYRQSLASFVRYKAHARQLPVEPTDVSHHLDSFEESCGEMGCEGINDPRCLPFHVFTTQCADLDEQQQRRRFSEVHGAGARRRDGRDLTWRLDQAFHGRDKLHVAGFELPPGFHWDVSVSDSPKTITTATERWWVSQYINVAPDAHLRGRRPYAWKIQR